MTEWTEVSSVDKVARLTSQMVRIRRDGPFPPVLIDWSCPVPFFGDCLSSSIATVGLNPSTREFVDPSGAELRGSNRRLPTLRSLGLTDWTSIDDRHSLEIVRGCLTYFNINPYWRWFAVLERILAPINYSYLRKPRIACHLDLIPYATREKWGQVQAGFRSVLLRLARSFMGGLLRVSPITTLILNGQSVVSEFQRLLDEPLACLPAPALDLPRPQGRVVEGRVYYGEVTRIGGVELNKIITVCGYNHNLQSSFGISSDIVDSVADWIRTEVVAAP